MRRPRSPAPGRRDESAQASSPRSANRGRSPQLEVAAPQSELPPSQQTTHDGSQEVSSPSFYHRAAPDGTPVNSTRHIHSMNSFNPALDAAVNRDRRSTRPIVPVTTELPREASWISPHEPPTTRIAFEQWILVRSISADERDLRVGDVVRPARTSFGSFGHHKNGQPSDEWYEGTVYCRGKSIQDQIGSARFETMSSKSNFLWVQVRDFHGTPPTQGPVWIKGGSLLHRPRRYCGGSPAERPMNHFPQVRQAGESQLDAEFPHMTVAGGGGGVDPRRR